MNHPTWLKFNKNVKRTINIIFFIETGKIHYCKHHISTKCTFQHSIVHDGFSSIINHSYPANSSSNSDTSFLRHNVTSQCIRIQKHTQKKHFTGSGHKRHIGILPVTINQPTPHTGWFVCLLLSSNGHTPTHDYVFACGYLITNHNTPWLITDICVSTFPWVNHELISCTK